MVYVPMSADIIYLVVYIDTHYVSYELNVCVIPCNFMCGFQP